MQYKTFFIPAYSVFNDEQLYKIVKAMPKSEKRKGTHSAIKYAHKCCSNSKYFLTLKPPIFSSIKNRLPFLGCLIHVDKIVLLREKQRLKKKKIKKIDYLVRTGKITQEKASERITAILATTRFDFLD